MFDTETTTFLQTGRSLIVATVGAHGAPHASRAWALTVLPDRRSVRLLVSADDATVAAHLRAGGRMAVTAADVRTLRSVQLKGHATPVEPATDDDRAVAERYIDRFFSEITDTDGTPRHLLDRFAPVDVAACVLHVEEAFDQTPGPDAGARLLAGDPVAPAVADAARPEGAPGARPPPPPGAAGERGPDPAPIVLGELRRCFEGGVPAVIATAAADGAPNVTYLSRVRMVDDERVALSNQFFSKTSRNLAENPRASVLLLDPVTYDQFRLTLTYERTERRGPVFERLRDDIDVLAALEGMQDVFRLRSADIYRVVDAEQVLGAVQARPGGPAIDVAGPDPVQVAELVARLSRCPDLDAVVDATIDGLGSLLGYEHALLMLLDESGTHLYTIASRGYEAEGVGSEVVVGEGVIGVAAAKCTPVRTGSLIQLAKYSRTVRREYQDSGAVGTGRDVPVPGLADVESAVAVPAVALGQLVGVLAVESRQPVAFGPGDERALSVVASLVASAVEAERARERERAPQAPAPEATPSPEEPAAERPAHVRFFAVDGSTFVDGDYLIKGVAGRILWALLRHHRDEGRVEFTNREVRLDPELELPEFKDNFESRLILLKRRLDERKAPVRIVKTGRGRFSLQVDAPLRLDAVPRGEG
jgi:adenylate cyclase